MPHRDPRIDAYIARAGEFARPILSRIRKLVHAACPAATETIKWSSPFYEHHGILVATPAFKRHCALIFWKNKLVFNDLPAKQNPTKGLRRLVSVAELPSDKILSGYIRKAAKLNEPGVKAPVRAKTKVKKLAVVPDYFLAALTKNQPALVAFEKFSPSRKREYVEWIVDAKQAETRARRLKTALEWIAQGKARNWKYGKC